MSRVRDLFFDEFYRELNEVFSDLEEREEDKEAPPVLGKQVREIWRTYHPNEEERGEALISVDGGVQYSHFAYGDFVAVGRACALIHWPGRDRLLVKDVKIYTGEVYSFVDRSIIPSYVRIISEYMAALKAAEMVLREGGRPVVLMDGTLYYARFPYADREYAHHPKLLAELFISMARLRCMAKDHRFPLVGVSKDSTVFYMYMELLKRALRGAGMGRLAGLVDDSNTPMELRFKQERWEENDRRGIAPFMDSRPLCDTALVMEATEGGGYTLPLLLAPSIYFRHGDDVPSLFRRIEGVLPRREADGLREACREFFDCPGVAVTYWRPRSDQRPFRVDVLASSLGYGEPLHTGRGNRLVEPDTDLDEIERALNHLGYWFCNDVEYNVPLKQADALARFDRNLYRSKYEPFIVDTLERAGRRIRGTRRIQREMQ